MCSGVSALLLWLIGNGRRRHRKVGHTFAFDRQHQQPQKLQQRHFCVVSVIGIYLSRIWNSLIFLVFFLFLNIYLKKLLIVATRVLVLTFGVYSISIKIQNILFTSISEHFSQLIFCLLSYVIVSTLYLCLCMRVFFF